MADTPAFQQVCAQLEAATSLSQLEARGTVRIALKEAGLEARSVAAAQMRVVLERVLPAELRSRGIEAPEQVCASLARALDALTDDAAGDSPDAVFARLGGR